MLKHKILALVLFLFVLAVAAYASCLVYFESKSINSERAIEIALEMSGFTPSQVENLTSEFADEIYQIKFRNPDKEYTFLIDEKGYVAMTREKALDSQYQPKISKEEAQNSALAYVNLEETEIHNIEVKYLLETHEYLVSFDSSNYAYSITVDADTGDVISSIIQ